MSETPSIFASWRQRLYLELAPTHGRGLGALRTASAAVIAAVLLLYLQMPVIAPGIYLIFLISYDVPYLTVKRSLHALAWQCVGTMAAIALVAVTDNDPMARVLGISAFTFLSAFLLQTGKDPQVGINIGVFSVLALTNWEMHRPPAQLVYLSFAPVFTGACAMGCKIVIEYVFTRRDPRSALQREMQCRLNAIAALFHAMATDVPAAIVATRLSAVTRLAFAGQGKMDALATEFRSRSTHHKQPQGLALSLIPLLVRLLDQAASLGRAGTAQLTGNWQEALEQLACRCEAIAALQIDSAAESFAYEDEPVQPLAAIAQNLDQIVAFSQSDPEELSDLPHREAPDAPWLRRDAFTNYEYMIFAGKLSLCATLCYVLYNALAWPGISTACLTVLIAGLSTSGASNQKLFCRLLGAIFGGVVLGIGFQIFIGPYADTLLPFLLFVFLVSFLAAWIARGAHFGYVGLQIAFSFYLVAFQETMLPPIHGGEFARSALPVYPFTAPLVLTQGRDRIVGILLALLVMWAVFHQIHPRRAIERMRMRLGHLLEHEARQIEQMPQVDSLTDSRLRMQAIAIVSEIRRLSEVIPYEFDRHVKEDLSQAESIEQALVHAGSLFLHLNTLAHSAREESDSFVPLLKIAAQLRALSVCLRDSSAEFPEGWTVDGHASSILRSAARSCAQLNHFCQQLSPSVVGSLHADQAGSVERL